MKIKTVEDLNQAAYVYILMRRNQERMDELKGREDSVAKQYRRRLESDNKALQAELDAINRVMQRIEDPELKKIAAYRVGGRMTWRDIALNLGGEKSSEAIKVRYYRDMNKIIEALVAEQEPVYDLKEGP